jgi:putative CocE/NonD family hydrolase
LNERSDPPPVVSPQVLVARDVPVPMRDGVTLLADHWYPARGATGPAILVRTPYGRAGNAELALTWARRGHHVVVQRCRGLFGSGGVFAPLDEAADGADTLAWLRAQDWFPGRVHTWGFSYLGLTQWAMCGPTGPDAMQISLSARSFDQAIIYPGDGFSMGNALAWLIALAAQERSWVARLWRIIRFRSRLRRAAVTLPPSEADRAATGQSAAFFRDWVEHSQPGDPWWQKFHFAADPAQVPPTVLLAGWQDLFLRGQVDDFKALRQAGRPVRLVIGDWTHHGGEAGIWSSHETFRLPSRPEQELSGPPVRLEVTGGGGWRDLMDWPPAAQPCPLHLTAAGGLSPDLPAAGQVAYTYDPRDPTPQVGGRALDPFDSGRRGQRRREARSDVVVFTGPVLSQDLTVVGEPEFEAWFQSTNPTVDLAVRLCEVDAKGVSRTVGDGYARQAGPTAQSEEGFRRGLVLIGPIAHRFAAGHRIRLQVASGAHPLCLRNPGAGARPTAPGPLTSSRQILRCGPDGCRLVLPQVALEQLPVAQGGPRPAGPGGQAGTARARSFAQPDPRGD